MTTLYVFPGQGSQKIGMGAEVFDRYPSYVQEASDILGYSIKITCLEDPHKQLNLTQFTQPLLYCVNALMYFQRIEESAKKPDGVAGHSLGEFNALLAAGAFDFSTGLRLVQKRGELMSQISGGGMAAVIGFSPEKIQSVLSESGCDSIDLANFNSPLQTVISGPEKDILSVKPAFESAGVRLFIPLPVSGAFHSRYMKKVQEEFTGFLKTVSFQSLSIPVIANVNAKAYQNERIAETLALQLTHPVQWTDTVRYFLSQPEAEIEEIGPGKVLTGLIRKIKTENTVFLNP